MDMVLKALEACPVVPVLTIHLASEAEALAQALVRAGFTVAEVTLRTEAALSAIATLRSAEPDLIIGAGTVLDASDIDAAKLAGSQFLVTPATDATLVGPLQDCGLPVFPGVATPSEALSLYRQGFTHLKFFPAESNGGVKAIKSIGAPMPDIKFMPTGGIKAETYKDYLALPNVVAVGGSWMVDKDSAVTWDYRK